MSNDNNNPMNQGAPYYPPFGYPYYPPMPEMQQQPAQQMPPQPQQPPMGWPQQPVWYPHMMPGFPPMGYPMPQQQPMMPPQQAMPHPHHPHHHHHAAAPGFDWSSQAQGMVEGMMGEQAGLLKNIISTIGADDKEFWKGAMIGAAATLLLTNESVRNMLMQTVANAGDLLKTGGAKVKDGVMSGAETIKETATTSSTIFRDTLKAGKEGFTESVERHRQPAPAAAAMVEGQESEGTLDEQQS
ncbi:MAG: YtxH domain-containing protein [Enterobacterales bacterium]|nr:YtxH domain-containing protein [Enterobacterales bacterium]